MTDVPWTDVLPGVMRFVQSSMLRGRCYAMLCRRMSLMWRHKLRQAVFRVNWNRNTGKKHLERCIGSDGRSLAQLHHSTVTRLPVVADGVVVVCEGIPNWRGDQWFACDAETGDVIWRSPQCVTHLVRCGKRDIAYAHDEDRVVHMRLGDNGRFAQCHEWQFPGPRDVCAAGDGVICMRSFVPPLQLAVFDTVTGAHMKFRRQLRWSEDYTAVSRRWLAVATNSVAGTHDAGVLVCSIFGTSTTRRIFMVQDGWRIEQLHILGDVLIYGTITTRTAEIGIRWRARNMATGQPIVADTLLPACGGRMSSQAKRFYANDGKQYIPFRGQVLHAAAGTPNKDETPVVYCER